MGILKKIKDNLPAKEDERHSDVADDTLKILLEKSNFEEPLLLACKCLSDYVKDDNLYNKHIDDKIDETFPDEEEDGFTTLAGFILSISGTVPDVNDKYQWERFCFEIVDLDGHQIDKILVTDLGEDYNKDEEEED